MKKRTICLFLSFLSLFPILFCGCGSEPVDREAGEKSTIFVQSMDTVMSITAYGSARTSALKAAEDEIERLNKLFSIGEENSDVSRANRERSAVLSPDSVELIGRAIEICRDTDGIFDITVAPLMDLWGFVNGDYHVPDSDELSDTLSRVNYNEVQINGDTIVLDGLSSIDLGGIAKGYTSAKLMDVFRDMGVKSAIVSLGGNVQCLNCKPGGTKWKVAIRDPEGDESSLAVVLEIEDCAVITSGGYERYFVTDDGKNYCHIIDPRNGMPADAGLVSVSIISKDGVLADALSTTLYIMGFDDAVRYWRNHKDSFDAVLIKKDGSIFATAGLEGSVTPIDSEKLIEIIK